MEDKNFEQAREQADNMAGFTPEELINDINADETAAGTTHLNEAVVDESAVEKLKAELAEQKDKYLRLFADFENFKRRNSKERLELIQTAGKEVITAMLDVLDDSERAEKVIEKSVDVPAIQEGVRLVFQKLRSTLEQKGLKAMESVGKDFDADLHEAITEIPAPAENLIGKVVDEVQKGYFLNEKIIRYAKVVVGK